MILKIQLSPLLIETIDIARAHGGELVRRSCFCGCRFRELGLWLTPLCKRPTADLAELICDKERYSREPESCGQVARVFQPMEQRT